MKLINEYSSYIQNLYQTKVGFGETFLEHEKSCEDGCVLCVGIRKQIEEQQKEESISIADVPGDKVQEYRKQMNLENKISTYYPSRDDIREDNGALRKDVYLVLQVLNFSDHAIQNYFGINNHEWQTFKKREFPTWTKDKNDILATEGNEALIRFNRERNVRKSRYGVSYFDRVDARKKV